MSPRLTASLAVGATLLAGVEAQLAWYPDEHAFGPSFFAAMARTTGFFRAQL